MALTNIFPGGGLFIDTINPLRLKLPIKLGLVLRRPTRAIFYGCHLATDSSTDKPTNHTEKLPKVSFEIKENYARHVLQHQRKMEMIVPSALFRSLVSACSPVGCWACKSVVSSLSGKMKQGV